MNEVQIFSFEHANVRTVMIDSEPYFVGKDVAEILGYSQTAKAIREHVEDVDKGVSVLDTPGGKQRMTVINESGTFDLILDAARQSTNPEIKAKARRFRHMVTAEILPSIRKTGGYQSQPALRLPENNMEMLQVVQSVSAETNKRVDELSNEFADLKESFGLPNEMRKRFTKARNKRVVEVMGGYHGTAYANKKVRSAVYRQLSNFLKERYVIDEYASLPMSKFDEAMRLTANWEPDEILSLAIDGANEQPLLNV